MSTMYQGSGGPLNMSSSKIREKGRWYVILSGYDASPRNTLDGKRIDHNLPNTGRETNLDQSQVKTESKPVSTRERANLTVLGCMMKHHSLGHVTARSCSPCSVSPAHGVAGSSTTSCVLGSTVKMILFPQTDTSSGQGIEIWF